MADASARVPEPVNEPVRAYAPGSAQKQSLKASLASLSAAKIEVTMHVGGEHRGAETQGKLLAPHRHDLEIATYAIGGDDDLGAAIDAALTARREWAATPFQDRAAVFLRAAALLAGPWRAAINAATMLGQSKTAHQAEIDAACELVDFWRFNVHYAEQLYAQQPLSDTTAWNRMEYRPLEGFVFAVSPFNFTSLSTNLATAPALMGNTVVWKPATQTLLVCHLMMELLAEAGLPPGVINLVTGDARRIGEKALAHRDLAGVHFTGSTEVFRWMWQEVAEHIGTYRTYPRLVGETGGKDFVVAHESADVDALRTALIRGAFEYQGQKCSAASRAYIPQSMWKAMRSDLAAEADGLRHGDVADFRNFVGAVIDKAAFQRHADAISRARTDSTAKILAGGETDSTDGWFVRPTVIETKDPRYWTMETELFGPILTVYPYPDGKYQETLELCDQTSPYGLTGAVFARDRAAIRQADAALVNAAGNFYVNDKPTGAVVGQQPFGGARASGTNDKAGSPLNLMRWTSARTVKETLVPPTDYRYPYMGEE